MPYAGERLNRVAFPMGGIGAGMICLEGTGVLSHVSVRNHMDFFHAPQVFAAVCVKGEPNVARLLEGPVPEWKYFGGPNTGRGSGDTSLGFPRFRECEFEARFPFGNIALSDPEMPIRARVTGWSPFIPGDPDSASLPAVALEYTFENPTSRALDLVFSFHTRNFMLTRPQGNSILPMKNGFVLHQDAADEAPQDLGDFAVHADGGRVIVDHGWFKGAWRDAVTLVWNNIEAGTPVENSPLEGPSPGASLAVPFQLAPGASHTVRLRMSWYVPVTNMRLGLDAQAPRRCDDPECCASDATFVPWYAAQFPDIQAVASHWEKEYDSLRKQSALFSESFYDSTLPPEVVEAVATNLTILKSPTVLRDGKGRFWAFEGCNDDVGCCMGSCTHVWNYAQAIPHLFPSLERSLRETEFTKSQNAQGHQAFRSALPIRHTAHVRPAAADGQLGGIMKMHREWRISGNTEWLRGLWPRVVQSLDYCIKTWDPRDRGMLEEPHHNTYDIEFWGPDGMCTSFYLGALAAAIAMGKALGHDTARYEMLLARGKERIESDLYDGEYFYQRIMTDELDAEFVPIGTEGQGEGYRGLIAEVNAQGPKYQYGAGCISDGVLGFWIARMCGLDAPIADPEKVRSHLRAVHRYNLLHDLSTHANPQRPSYALGDDGGLLLCSWPKGGELAIPFVYSDEVWTGIEYQVASHCILEGLMDEGLEIVRVCRDRYDGTRRNPFNEYECGHWYARALASYGLIQALTGVRYDAIDKTLHVDSKIGDFRSFLAWDGGFGTVSLRRGRPSIDVKHGKVDVQRIMLNGEEWNG
jgi:uncharacterized protein (DUF608 family)